MEDLSYVLKKFGFAEDVSYETYGNGHINDTFRVGVVYILQRINTNIFKDVDGLMRNITLVTGFLKEDVRKSGGDVNREVLTLVPAVDGKNYVYDEAGGAWRLYRFIENSLSLDAPESNADMAASGLGFGQFQRRLNDFDAHQLTETIPSFHDTRKRFGVFEQAVKDDVCGRLASVKSEVDFALARKALVWKIMDAYSKLPLRVTHNDTKLNNVLLDKTTRQPLCVIDLDTVMPGIAANDFGDAVRFGASTAAEDEKDLNKVHFDLEKYNAFRDGFLAGCGDIMTEEEIASLPMGTILMTFECGMRFLTDYLQGDVYFKTAYPEHNLDRCRTQFKLVSEQEKALL